MTPTTTAAQIRRPTYQEGQLLEVAELQAEQQSRTEALNRHEENIHTPGVITGLQVTAAAATAGDIQIQPGLAIDGAGRYLSLDRPLTTSLTDGEDVTISIVWRQGAAQIELSDRPPPAETDRTQDAWPVVLGQAARSAGTVTVSADAREDLRLRAATLSAPAGGSRVLLGGQSGRRTQILGVQLAGGADWDDVTTVDADGSCRVSADIGVDVDLQAGGRVVLEEAIPAPPAAAPWSLYRATLTRPDNTIVEQFRLEVGELKSGVDPQALELFVAADGTGATTDLMHVDASGTVTIPGGLTVEGVATATGSPGPLPSGTTLASLAAQEADLLAAAQLVLNQLTNTDLRAGHAGVTHAGTMVSYTLQLTSSVATAVNAVSAYETVTAPHSPISQGFVAQDVNLPTGSTVGVVRTIDVGATGLTVTITVVAIGVGQDGQPRIGTDSFQAAT